MKTYICIVQANPHIFQISPKTCYDLDNKSALEHKYGRNEEGLKQFLYSALLANLPINLGRIAPSFTRLPDNDDPTALAPYFTDRKHDGILFLNVSLNPKRDRRLAMILDENTQTAKKDRNGLTALLRYKNQWRAMFERLDVDWICLVSPENDNDRIPGDTYFDNDWIQYIPGYDRKFDYTTRSQIYVRHTPVPQTRTVNFSELTKRLNGK